MGRLGRGSLWAGLTFVVIVLATGVVSHLLERADWTGRWIEDVGTATSDVQRASGGRAVLDVRYRDHLDVERESTLPLFSFQGRDDLTPLLAARVGDAVPVLVPREGGQAYVAPHLVVDVPPWLWAALAFGVMNAVFVRGAWWLSGLLQARSDRRSGLSYVGTSREATGTPRRSP